MPYEELELSEPSYPVHEANFLPQSYYEPSVLNSLSSDGQVYLTRKSDKAIVRVEPLLVPALFGGEFKGDDASQLLGHLAAASYKNLFDDYDVILYIRTASCNCDDCGHKKEYALEFGRTTSCEQCGSAQVSVLSYAGVEPPTQCLNLGPPAIVTVPMDVGADGHTWGLSFDDDSVVLMNLARYYLGVPESAAYLSLLYSFSSRVVKHQMIVAGEGNVSLLRTSAFIARNLGRRAFSPTASISAVHALITAAAFCPDEFELINVFKELANSCADFLVKFGIRVADAYALSGNLDNVIANGLMAAMKGLEITNSVRQVSLEQARVSTFYFEGIACDLDTLMKFLSAELVVSYATIQRLAGDSREDWEAALNMIRNCECQDVLDRMPKKMQGMFLSEYAQTQALLVNRETSEADIQTLVETIKKLYELVDQSRGGAIDRGFGQGLRETWALTVAKVLDVLGASQEAHSAYMLAVNFSLHDWEPVGNEHEFGGQLERRADLFSSMANLYVRFGWSFESLSLTETYRGMAISYSALSPEARDQASIQRFRDHLITYSGPASYGLVIENGKQAFGQRMASRGSDPYGLFEDDYELPGLSERILDLFVQCSSPPTAIVSIEICQDATQCYHCAAIVLGPPQNPARQYYYREWALPEECIETIRNATWQRPSGFRERRLRKLAGIMQEHVVGELVQLFREFPEVRRLLFVLPGLLSNLPLEAALQGVGTPPHFECFFMPSLWFGKGLADYRSPGRKSRLLVLSYGGDDLLNSAAEVDFLVKVFPGKATVLDGSVTTKRGLLAEFNQPYDYIHIVSHAKYDQQFPEESAIFFSSISNADSTRLTAMDVLSSVQLPNAPVVILSSCSSCLISEEKTNTWRGLAGSFLSAGARCVVGTRWPVRDEAAFQFVKCYAQKVFANGETPLQGFASTKHELRGAALEDWACFGYLGAP